MGSLRIETRYGYLIDALRRYPFDKEIKERIEEITFPYQNFDENWYIKSKTAKNTPEALKNVIMKENDPELIRLYTLTQAIEEYKAECGSTNWEAIRALYVTRSKNVEGVAFELFMSKNSVYRHIIKPFFEGLEKKYTSIFLKSR
nr:MAG TPA: transcriptional activator [Caudoviricetes sp.]DAU93675.1 MAG TPA: transcriptional activator [Caudoviricetes sp.]